MYRTSYRTHCPIDSAYVLKQPAPGNSPNGIQKYTNYVYLKIIVEPFFVNVCGNDTTKS